MQTAYSGWVIAPSAVGTVVPALRAPAARPAAAPPRPAPAPAASWQSGFCGPHADQCDDGRGFCPGSIRNGSQATKSVLFCGCFCHDEYDTAAPF